MRRAAEWFLLPLFLLPVAGAIGFHIWAQHDYEMELTRYAEAGAAEAGVWLADDGAGRAILTQSNHRSSIGNMLRSRPHSASRAGLKGPYNKLITVGDRHAYVPGGMSPLMWQLPWEWTLSPTYPAGLLPEALADPQTRLALETRTPQPAAGRLDPASKDFRELLDSPELRRLARAPLPAATKLYLVRRWMRQGVTLPLLKAAERVLAFMPRAEEVLLNVTTPLPRGVHVRGDVVIHARPPEEPALAPLRTGEPQLVRTLAWHAADGDLTTLHYLGPVAALPRPDVLWQGRLEKPLAGQWAFTRRFGPDWWSVPRYRGWSGPLAALLLAFLCIPSALLIAMRRRRRLDEARSRFINELAHDLRTPLTSLRLYAEMLGRDPSGDAKRDRYAEVLTRESERVTAMLGNLLDLSRLDDGRRHLELQAIDVAPLAAEAREAFTVLYPERGADLSLAGRDDTQATADPSALARCLANLLENAGKYTDPGTAIRVSWRTVGEEVRVVVRDDGPGIPASERSAAFERYARGARAKRDGLPGTGLGLALVKELLTEMRGSVRLLSPPEGTEIEMRLPKAPA